MPPKRKATSVAGNTRKKAKVEALVVSTRRSPRSRSKSTEPSSEPEDTATLVPITKAGKANAKKATEHWEIVGNDSRDRLKVGVPEPHRLVLKLRERTSGQDKTFDKYKEKAKDFDWDDAKQVAAINKYRDTACTRHNLGVKVVKHPWTPYETAFLELMYQKLQGITPTGHISKPHENKISDAFNNFFEGRTDLVDQLGRVAPARQTRDKSSFTSYVNRPTGTIRALRDPVKEELRNKSAGAWIPNITDAEIDAHLKKGKAKDKGTAPGDATSVRKKKATPKPKVKDLPDVGKSKLDDTHEANKKGGDKGPTIAPPSDNEDIDMYDPPGMPASKPLQHISSQLTSHPEISKTTSGDDKPRVNVVTPPLAPKVTTKEEFAKLRAQGWSVPDLPTTDEEALRQHRGLTRDVADEDAWPISAELALADRLSRRPLKTNSYYTRNGVRNEWNQDLLPDDQQEIIKEKDKEKTKNAKEQGKGNEGSEEETKPMEEKKRYDTAATINAVLNYAIIPPFGYQGNIHDLRDDARMPESERILAETSDAALGKLHKEHDEAFNKYCTLSGEEVEEGCCE
jgi:hypothetical protein